MRADLLSHYGKNPFLRRRKNDKLKILSKNIEKIQDFNFSFAKHFLFASIKSYFEIWTV